MPKIEFCILDRQNYSIVTELFRDIDDIEVSMKSIVNGSYSTIIAPGNSFAEMNGGADGIINYHLSSYTPDKYIQNDVKEIINSRFAGELPVGQSILVKTNHPKHTHLIYSPTMRVAEDVSNTLNAYLSFRSVVLLLKEYGLSASTPIFCSGAGGMSVTKACKQMKEAYLSVINESLINGDWIKYHSNHRYLNGL